MGENYSILFIRALTCVAGVVVVVVARGWFDDCIFRAWRLAHRRNGVNDKTVGAHDLQITRLRQARSPGVGAYSLRLRGDDLGLAFQILRNSDSKFPMFECKLQKCQVFAQISKVTCFNIFRHVLDFFNQTNLIEGIWYENSCIRK